MLLELENKVASFIKADGLFESADRILLAVSGGADSTALMYTMQALKDEGVLSAELLCCHINHQLRGSEAELDEDFVIREAAKLKFGVETKRLDVRRFARENRLSIETAARKLRIEGLLDIAKANNCKWVATAHQKNDNGETVLQRLLRGTGFRGLGGIWPVRSFAEGIGFVRPLLCVRRDEVIDYLEERNLEWRVDHTNYDCTYRRNFIRHRLIPALQQDCSSSIVEQLSDLSQSARKFYSLVCGCADKVWAEVADCSKDDVRLNLDGFSTQPDAVKVELVRRSVVGAGSGERDLTHRHYEKILQLAERNMSGGKVTLPNAFVAYREYGNLVVAQAEKTLRPYGKIAKGAEVEVPGQTKFGNYAIEATVFEVGEKKCERFKTEKSKFVEWFDLNKVKLPLKVRFREAGDLFWPLGLAGEKKVGKFLTAARVPQRIRKEALIVADSEKIIWVWPIRMSERVKVTGETRKILQLQITDAG